MAFSQWRESFAQVAQRSRKWSGKVSWAVLETGGARAVQDLCQGADLQMFSATVRSHRGPAIFLHLS